MFLQIDYSSGIPIYRQIMEQVRSAIARGVLRPGDRLPAIRALALDLKVNLNTVVKAYSKLEDRGVIHTRRGMGTYVSEGTIEIPREEKMKRIGRIAERLALEAVQLDIDDEELEKIVAEALARFRKRKKGEREQ